MGEREKSEERTKTQRWKKRKGEEESGMEGKGQQVKLNRNGVVYNEMRGVYSSADALMARYSLQVSRKRRKRRRGEEEEEKKEEEEKRSALTRRGSSDFLAVCLFASGQHLFVCV